MHLLHPAPSRPARLRVAGVLAAGAAALLAGCASAPAILPPAKTTLVSTAIVGPAVNPDHRKRPSPVIVRVYELKATALFESTDFVTLFEKDQAALGPELLSREEFVLRPNDVKAINKTLSPDAKFIGVVAGFRDLDRARWRVSAPVVANKQNTMKIRIDDVNVTITRDE
ncbi:type VI secretion system lipoprotein TssJ [Rhizobacter sp. LjRoot28]|jgi:type VI secretion system protein VasD|uniref:type VI secretion system lipoprotein TssJ n=1 Tax=Rhizobacter sp. LjRoot28 TaxID=3342309 RepID=UPI003ECE1AC0